MDRRRSARGETDLTFGKNQVRSALTGPYALSLKLVPFFALAFSLLSLGADLGSTRGERAATGVYVVVQLAGLITMLLFYVAVKSLMRLSKAPLRHPIDLVLISGAGGAAMGLTIASLQSLLALQSAVGPAQRVIAAFLVSLLCLPAEAVLLSSRAWVRALRAQNDRDQTLLERTRFAQTELASSTRRSIESALEREVESTIAGATIRFDNAVAQKRPHEELHGLLREVAQTEFRLLASDLWGPAQPAPVPSSRRTRLHDWWAIVLTPSDHQPFYPGLATLMLATCLSASLLRSPDSVESAPYFAFSLAVFYLFQRVGKQVLLRLPRFRALTLIATLMLSALFPTLLTVAFPNGHLFNIRPTSWLLGCIFFGLVALAVQAIIISGSVSLVSIAASQRLMRKRVASAHVETEQVNAEIARESRRWATYLHGQVQSRFLAAASLLEQSTRSGDPQEEIIALEKASLLLRGLAIDPVVARSSLREELDYRAALWSGLVRIDLVLGELDCLPATVSLTALGEAAEEGISNAVRHGHARQVTIVYAPRTGGYLMEVSDDGLGLIPGSTTGMGSALLSEVSGGDWSLTRDVQLHRTVLRINLV